MKRVPFNVIYRPMIECGRYQVVTRNNINVRIVCFDAPGRKSIYGFLEQKTEITIFTSNSSTSTSGRPDPETIISWYPDGAYSDNRRAECNIDLFVNIPELGEPDKTEYPVFDYIREKRSSPEFRYNHCNVSWNELPEEIRRKDYSYYFNNDIDCYPFIITEDNE